jgi:hypothetical protein
LSDRGHAAVELAMAVAVLLLPVGLVVTAFGPWSEHRVLAESMAAEAARAVAIDLDHGSGTDVVMTAAVTHGMPLELVRLGWCGTPPADVVGAAAACPLVRGSEVVAEVLVWTPLFDTPWGEIGGLWVTALHAEPVDLYRSLG